MMVYFSPDCDHCHQLMEEVLQSNGDFKNVQIILISNESIPQLKQFENSFELKRYKQVKVGTEGRTYLVQRYYDINRFPFIALFDRSGRELALFRDPPKMKQLCKLMGSCP